MKFYIASFFLFFTILLIGQNDTGKETNTKVIQVTNSIYMIEGKGGNIGVQIGNDGVLMIDDQYAAASEAIMEDIERLSKKPIKFLINTHHHGDHTGGNMNFAKEGAIIFSHEKVRERLLSMVGKDDKLFDEDHLPVVTFNEELKIHFNGEAIHAFHIESAHTDGDVAIFFPESNVLHTGDTFFNGKYPYIDLESGGTLQGYLDGLQQLKMLANKDTKIIPGHGPLATIDDFDETIGMLTYLWKQVTYHYKRGRELKDIIQMKDITAEYEAKNFGKGYVTADKIITTIYNEVVRMEGPVETGTMEERLQKKFKKQQEANEKNGG
ncbi:MBL fold metallo-hydrolase [Luteirhabdus pelagi]|uniref:MBL fold metallo-hydrolase n=1 Tax=Luteirhabdus pelagi TaxID=2792783 RepID=UPI00193940F1|nr:MBL fold metallo-hydrolase [Luteirhabdus pelagi]